MLKTSVSIKNTKELAKQLAEDLKKKPQNIFLIGELGAGKTTFIKGLGEGLGIKDEIVSPSFQLVRKYSGYKSSKLIHIDLYRLKSIDEILQLGWWELLEENGVTAVEWADRAMKILPEEALFVRIGLISKKKRSIEIFRHRDDIYVN